MHISDGVLAFPVLAAGAAIGLAGTALGLRRLNYDRLPLTAILAAGFFVASLINVPIGPARVHLVLNGLMGLLLGWAAFPAMLVALALQALLFQFGGLTSLGANLSNMALPAVGCGILLGPLARSRHRRLAAAAGFAAGAGSLLLSGIMVALCLRLSGEAFWAAAQAVLIAHLPVAGVEGFITLAAVLFLAKVQPAMLHGSGVTSDQG